MSRTGQTSVGLRLAGVAVLCLWTVLAGPSATALSPPALVAVPNPFPANDAEFGVGVARLDDLNGDGVGDLAVGAPGAGRVDLLSGADRSLIRSIDDPDALAEGGFGFAVAAVGDSNGDGVQDIAVGAPGSCFGISCLPPPCPNGQLYCPLEEPDAGRAFIFSGATGELLRTLVPTSEFDGWHFGFSLASLGDITGDGVPDVAVSDPVVGLPGYGEVRVFSGATGAELWVTREPPFPTMKPDAGSFGMFLGAVEDLTGDGRSDLVVGTPLADLDPDPAVSDVRGQAYLLSGATGAIVRTHQDPSGGFFGGGVGGIGDQNGDGFKDYAIGDSGAGRLQVFSGKDGTVLSTLLVPGTASAYSIAQTQDWSGDGTDDLWVGVVGTGTVFLMTGAGAVLGSAVDPAADSATIPLQDRFGYNIATTDDLGADPQPDLLVGDGGEAVGVDPRAGSAYLVLLCVDTQPPAIDVSASPSVLWPPDHKYRTVHTTVVATDDTDTSVTVVLSSVTSNEPDDGANDGNTVHDVVVVNDHTFLLRAERASTGSGRVYTITYLATDECGNTATGVATVRVPIASP
jgi:hypothetical protein